jgi:multidrug efflux pump subunit AcrB
MNRNAMLVITALLSNLLLQLHLADDILISGPRGLTNLTAIAVFLVYLIGTLLLNRRRSGFVIMFLGGIIAAGMPVLHMYYGIGPKRGLFFIWGLLALGTLGVFSAILAVQEFRSLRRDRHQ